MLTELGVALQNWPGIDDDRSRRPGRSRKLERFYMAMTSYAQNFEDVYIHRAFKDVPEGFYIDVGAYHPEIDSVTRFFYDRGWCGLNIEPGPSFVSFAGRTRDVNLRLAVSDRTGVLTFFYHEGDPGTSTVMPNLPYELVDRVGVRRAETVPCMTLAELIQTHAADRHIHFLKLDIEGAERSVILSTNWRKIRPELLIIESTLPYTNTRRDDWGAELAADGYSEVFFDGINSYYLREESLFRKTAFYCPVNVLDGFSKFDPALSLLQRRVEELEYAAEPKRGAVFSAPAPGS